MSVIWGVQLVELMDGEQVLTDALAAAPTCRILAREVYDLHKKNPGNSIWQPQTTGSLTLMVGAYALGRDT